MHLAWKKRKKRKKRKGRRRKNSKERKRKDSKERKKRKERKERQARRQEGKKGRKIKEEREEKKEREERKKRNFAMAQLSTGTVRKPLRPQPVPAVTSTGLRRSLWLPTGDLQREPGRGCFGSDLDTNPTPGSPEPRGSRPCPNLGCKPSTAEHRAGGKDPPSSSAFHCCCSAPSPGMRLPEDFRM